MNAINQLLESEASTTASSAAGDKPDGRTESHSEASSEGAMQCLYTAIDFFQAFTALAIVEQHSWVQGISNAAAAHVAGSHHASSPAAEHFPAEGPQAAHTLPACEDAASHIRGASTDHSNVLSELIVGLSRAHQQATTEAQTRTLASACSHIAGALRGLAESHSTVSLVQGALTPPAWGALGGVLNVAGTYGSQMRFVALLNALLHPSQLPSMEARSAFVRGLVAEGPPRKALGAPSSGQGDWFWGVELAARCVAEAPRSQELLFEFAVTRGGLSLLLRGLEEYLNARPGVVKSTSQCIAIVHGGLLASVCSKDIRVRCACLEVDPVLVRATCRVFTQALQMAHAARHLEGMRFAACALCDLSIVESETVASAYAEFGTVQCLSSVAVDSMSLPGIRGGTCSMDEGVGSTLALALSNMACGQQHSLQGAVATPLPLKALHLMLGGLAGDGAALHAGKALASLDAAGGAVSARLRLLQDVFEGDDLGDVPSECLLWLLRQGHAAWLCRGNEWDTAVRWGERLGIQATPTRLAWGILLALLLCVLVPLASIWGLMVVLGVA